MFVSVILTLYTLIFFFFSNRKQSLETIVNDSCNASIARRIYINYEAAKYKSIDDIKFMRSRDIIFVFGVDFIELCALCILFDQRLRIIHIQIPRNDAFFKRKSYHMLAMDSKNDAKYENKIGERMQFQELR